MAFPDPIKPIASCAASTCVDCPVSKKIHCHFRPKELLHFLLISLPGFVIGGAVMLTVGIWPLALYIAIVIGFFGFLEIRVMCSHCPHYAEDGLTLACWANHGSPKLWKYRPGPMSNAEKFWFFSGLVVVWGYPLPFFFHTDAWLLLVLYVMINAAFFNTLTFFLCSKCMNFACPLNTVDQVSRALFFQRNPSVACHWDTDKRFDL
ncbi:MAG: hypothetical protein KJO32_15600 [Deltaproteobacteria bacterium]|nr:hypothetical protein [Deltaproteobacteria bacterium]